jgi:hypothetical protein
MERVENCHLLNINKCKHIITPLFIILISFLFKSLVENIQNLIYKLTNVKLSKTFII